MKGGKLMNKPYTVIFNRKGIACVTINKRVADDESSIIQRFKDDGFTVRDVTEVEFKEINKNGNFNPF